jgi:hypothetical protein
MSGNKSRFSHFAAAFVLGMLVVVVSSGYAKERRLPESPFRFGIEGEPGFKFVNGPGFQLDYGLVFKIRERFSIIPRFGMQPYEYEYTYHYSSNQTEKETRHTTAMNLGLTFRYEFVRRLTIENTRYEYNVEKHEFNHYYYASAFRPYVQWHAGTLVGFGGGVSYYVAPQVGLGLGADVGWNILAMSDHQTGFAVIAPKAVVTFLFN